MARLSGLLIMNLAQLLCLYHQASAYVAQTIDLHGCQGRLIPMEECSFTGSKMRVVSVTIYATGNATRISLSNCFSIQDCRRTIHSEDDVGLTEAFRHLYQWIVHKCEGKERCDRGRLPEWWKLTADFIDNDSSICPKAGTKYFAAIHAHVSCIVEDLVPTRAPPPETTPRTTPTTPVTTTLSNIYIPIYIPELIDREKIVLGVAIAISLAIILLILLTLYCCERYRQHKRMGTLLQKLGAPQADADRFIDDLEYTKPDEQWNHRNYNADCMAEYSGVKPDEFVTLDRASTNSRLFITSHTTLYATNSCTTLNKSRDNKDLWSLYRQNNLGYQNSPKVQDPSQTTSKGFAPGLTSPVKLLSYDSAENLDMERRMADELGPPKKDFNCKSIKSITTEADTLSHNEWDNNPDGESSSSDRTTDSTSISGGHVGADAGSIHDFSDETESESDSGSYNFDNRELHVIVEDCDEEEHEENHRYTYYTVAPSWSSEH